MDDQRFDRLTRTLARATSRRGLVKGAVATALAGIAGRRSLADSEAAGCSNTCPPGQYLGSGCRCLCLSTGRAPIGNSCPCPSGTKDCGGGVCAKCCAVTDCPASTPCTTWACAAGQCVSTPVTCTQLNGPCAEGVCNPATGCVAQPANQGQACADSDGNPCTNGTCQGTSCVPGPVENGTACPGGTCCSGTCRDLQTDEQSCGGCGIPCGEGETCIGGSCCPSGRTCNGGTVCCPSGQTCQSGTTCCAGSQLCGSACCPSGQTCVAGACCLSSQVCNDATVCCQSGQSCVGGTTCCDSGQVCGSTCCSEGEHCVDGTCCPANQACNGDTICCANGQTCLGVRPAVTPARIAATPAARPTKRAWPAAAARQTRPATPSVATPAIRASPGMAAARRTWRATTTPSAVTSAIHVSETRAARLP